MRPASVSICLRRAGTAISASALNASESASVQPVLKEAFRESGGRLPARPLARIVPSHLRAVAARPHVTPPPAVVPAGVHEQPIAVFRGAPPNVDDVAGDEQIARRSDAGP